MYIYIYIYIFIFMYIYIYICIYMLITRSAVKACAPIRMLCLWVICMLIYSRILSLTYPSVQYVRSLVHI